MGKHQEFWSLIQAKWMNIGDLSNGNCDLTIKNTDFQEL
jgi:hypothetical protein